MSGTPQAHLGACLETALRLLLLPPCPLLPPPQTEDRRGSYRSTVGCSPRRPLRSGRVQPQQPHGPEEPRPRLPQSSVLRGGRPPACEQLIAEHARTAQPLSASAAAVDPSYLCADAAPAAAPSTAASSSASVSSFPASRPFSPSASAAAVDPFHLGHSLGATVLCHGAAMRRPFWVTFLSPMPRPVCCPLPLQAKPPSSLHIWPAPAAAQ